MFPAKMRFLKKKKKKKFTARLKPVNYMFPGANLIPTIITDP